MSDKNVLGCEFRVEFQIREDGEEYTIGFDESEVDFYESDNYVYKK